jgi:hypothetical protein
MSNNEIMRIAIPIANYSPVRSVRGYSPAFCMRQIVGAERRTSPSTSLESMMSDF